MSAPADPHWKEGTGIALWGTIPESGVPGEQSYHYRLYRMDTELSPDPDVDECIYENSILTNTTNEFMEFAFATKFEGNGYYYFDVCAEGDGTSYANSSYVMSDAFEYTGESAPPLPSPTELAWRLVQPIDDTRLYYATWSNLDDYEDDDHFNVVVVDKDDNYVMNNIWSKKRIMEDGYDGVKIRPEFLSESEGPYRFAVQALSSRPNEYSSSFLPEIMTDEYFSPWFNN